MRFLQISDRILSIDALLNISSHLDIFTTPYFSNILLISFILVLFVLMLRLHLSLYNMLPLKKNS